MIIFTHQQPTNVCVELTSLCFVLLELLVDGCDGVQQHFDFLHTAETHSASHTDSFITHMIKRFSACKQLTSCPQGVSPLVASSPRSAGLLGGTCSWCLALFVQWAPKNQRPVHTCGKYCKTKITKHRAPTAAHSEHFNSTNCLEQTKTNRVLVLETAVN